MLLIRFPARLRSFKSFRVSKPCKCRQQAILKITNSDHPGSFRGCSNGRNCVLHWPRGKGVQLSHACLTLMEPGENFKKEQKREEGKKKRSEWRNHRISQLLYDSGRHTASPRLPSENLLTPNVTFLLRPVVDNRDDGSL